MAFMHLLLKTDSLFIKMPGTGMIASLNGGLLVAYTEHGCGEGCVVSESGAAEAFLAGYMRSLVR